MSSKIPFLVLFLPLFFWPEPLKFELAKIVFFLGFSFFLVLEILIKTRKLETYWPKLDQKWFFWVGILFLSTLLNQKLPFGFLAGGYRHQGVIFFLLLGIFGLVIKTLNLKEKKKVLFWASIAILIETFIVCGQGLALRLNLPLLSYNQRPIGTLGEPNAVAGFLVLGLPILLYSIQKPVVLLMAIPAITIALIFTSSKAGILAFLAELITFVFFWPKKFPLKKILLTSLLVLLILLGIGGVWLEKNQSRFENRWLVWGLGLQALQEKPILGYGAEGIIQVYEKQYQQIARSLEGMVIDRSHNLFLDIALSSGLGGLIAFGSWLWQIKQRINQKKRWVLVPLVGFLVFSFFQPLGVTHWLYFILLIS